MNDGLKHLDLILGIKKGRREKGFEMVFLKVA